MGFIKDLLRLFGFILVILLVIAILALGFLTTFLSSHWGEAQIRKIVEQQFSEQVEWKTLDLHFFGPQHVKKLNIQDRLTVDELTLDAPIYSFLFGFNRTTPLTVKNLNLNYQGISLQNVTGEVKIQKNAPFVANFSGETQFEGKKGEFLASLSLFLNNQWEIDPSKPHNLKIEATQFPVAILDTFSNVEELPSKWIGDTLDIRFQETSATEGRITCQLSAHSERLNATLNFILKPDELQLQNIGHVDLTLLPQTFNAIELLVPTKTTFAIQELKIPYASLEDFTLKSDLQIDPTTVQYGDSQLQLLETSGHITAEKQKSHLHLAGVMKGRHFTLRADFDPLIKLQNAKLEVEEYELFIKPKTDDRLTLSLHSPNIQMESGTLLLSERRLTSNLVTVASPEIALHSPTLTWDDDDAFLNIPEVTFEPGTPPLHNLEGRLDFLNYNFYLSSPELQFSKIDSEIQGSWQNLPIEVLCALLSLNEEECRKVLFSLGERCRGKLLYREQGEIEATLTGQLGRCNLIGRIAQDHLTLSQPFHVESHATPELGRYVLSDFLSFFKSLKAGSEPISLTIANQDFYIPIDPLIIEKAHIRSGKITLGKLWFNADRELRELLSLLTKEIPETINIWMTPLYFSLSQEILTIHRTDMLLLDRYPMAFWGSIDLGKNQVRMTLGISEEALETIIGIDLGGTSKMLTIPISGKMESASLDMTVATRKIGTLLATGKTGPIGSAIGLALDILGTALGEKPPPNPTTSPLPWDGTLPKKKKTTRDPIKNLEKSVLPFVEKILR